MSGFSFDINLFKKQGIDLNQLSEQGGLKKTDNMSDAQKSIFDKLDKNQDGVLDKQELQDFQKAADGGEKGNNDGNVTWKETQAAFGGKDGLKYQDADGKTKTLSENDMAEFLQSYANDGSAGDISSATKDKVNGEEATVLNYNNGDTEAVYGDNSSTYTSTAEDGTVTTTEKRPDKTIEQTTVDSETNTVVSDYAEDGETLTKVTDTNKQDGSVSTTNYEDGKATSKDVQKGTTEAHYELDNGGNEVLTNRKVDKGAYTETTEFSHNEDGTVTSSTVAGDKTTVKNIKNPEQKNNNITGTVTDETVTEPGKQTVKEFDDNGNVTHQVEKYGENPENPDKQNEITYNQDGSRTEVFTQPEKNYKQTDEYNAEGFKTKQTAEVDGKTYEATYDGKGHGSLTMKAGESIDMFCQRTGVPKSEVSKLNKFPGGVPQAGQSIVVPDKYVKATDSANYDVSSESEKAKGDAAEIKQKETVANSDQVYEQKGTKGKYSSYEEYARELMQKEGIPTNNQMLVDKYTKKISDMNDGKPIAELDTIKTPMTKELKQKTVENDAKIEEEKKQKAQIDTAKSNLAEIKNANAEARSKFEEEMKNENFTHWAADGISKAWNNRFINLTGNTAKQVREELDAYDRAAARMEAALAKGDMEEFKRQYKDTYHKDYDGNLSGDIHKINDRVSDYNDSQQTGGTVVEGTIKGVGALGGAAGAAGMSVLVDVAKDATTGVKDAKGEYHSEQVADNFKDLKEHAGEKVVEYGVNAGLSAGAAKAGQMAGKYVGDKLARHFGNKAFTKIESDLVANNLTNQEADVMILNDAGSKLVDKALKTEIFARGTGSYAADNITSDVVSGAKDIYTGNWAGVANSSAGGVVADAGKSAIKKTGKGISKGLGKLIK